MRLQFDNVSASESRNIKLILSYMLSYTGAGNTCFPSIATISKDLNMSKTNVIETLKIAVKLNLIDKQKMYPNDPLKRNNKYLLKFLTSQNLNYQYSKSELRTSDNCTFEVHTLEPINNSINNNKINNKKNTYIRQIKEVIDYLNLKASKRFTYNNKPHVLGRLKEGFGVRDLKRVIDIKVKDKYFIDNPQHLNPDTLFRPANFEKYLNSVCEKKSIEEIEWEEQQALKELKRR